MERPPHPQNAEMQHLKAKQSESTKDTTVFQTHELDHGDTLFPILSLPSTPNAHRQEHASPQQPYPPSAAASTSFLSANGSRLLQRPGSPRAIRDSRRGPDPRRSSTVQGSLRYHGHTWRPRWYHPGAAHAEPSVLRTPTTASPRPRLLLHTPTTSQAATTLENPHEAPVGLLHQQVKRWYSTLLRSRHARQADQVLARDMTPSTEEAKQAAGNARRAQVEAVVQRATGHRGDAHASQNDSQGPSVTIPSTTATTRAPDTSGDALHGEEEGFTKVSASLNEDSPLLGGDPCHGSLPAHLGRQKTRTSASSTRMDAEREPALGLSLWARLIRSLAASLKRTLLSTSYKELVGLWGCVLMVLAGNALQVISLNFWLKQFPLSYGTPGNYTTLAVSSIMFSVFFLVVLGVYLVMERPDLRFLWHKHGALLLLCVGCADLACSCLTIYAASHTSEILQALFTSTAPIFTAFFQKHILRDPRRYANPSVVIAFASIVVGVVLASSYGFLHPLFVAVGVEPKHGVVEARDALTSDRDAPPVLPHWQLVVWSLLFFCSVIPSVVQNVVQTKYMLYFTRDPLFERWVITKAAQSSDGGAMADERDLIKGNTRDTHRHHRGPFSGCLTDTNDDLCLACGRTHPTPTETPTAQCSDQLLYATPSLSGDSPRLAQSTSMPTSLWLLKKPEADRLPSTSSTATTPTALTSKVDKTPSALKEDRRESLGDSPQIFDFAHATAFQSPPLQPMSPRSSRAARYGTFPSATAAAAASRPDEAERELDERMPRRRLPDGAPPPLSPALPLPDPITHPCPPLSLQLSGRSGTPDNHDDSAARHFSVACECTRIWVGYGHLVPGEDLIVKLVLLAVETTIQAVGALLLLPMDALPFWGGSHSVGEAAENFARGLSCVLTCPHNMSYGFLYCLGFVFMYIGAVYLDQVSVTFCSMVTQLAAPCTALLLIAYPHLNLTGDYTPWWLSCVAIGFLATGTIIFTVWDQYTAEEKAEGEHEVKRAYVKPFLVVERDGRREEFPM